jgi:DNA replication protein DnaC
VLFTSAMALMTTLVKGHAEGRLGERLARLAKPKLLIMDEFGYLPFEGADWFLAHAVLSTRKTAWAAGGILAGTTVSPARHKR